MATWPFIHWTEIVQMIGAYYSEREHLMIYRLRRQRDRRVADVRESALLGYDGMTPQGLKARLEAGETVEVEITHRVHEPYHWTREA